VDLLVRLVGKLPRTWLLRATHLRFRYPVIEPLLDWCLDLGLRGRDSVIQRGIGKGLRFNCDHGPISFVFGTLEIRCEALGRGQGNAEFVVSEKSMWGKLATAGPAPADAVGRITVALMNLDTLVNAGAIAPPGLMKIDVEGAEVDVLAGATATLRRCRPVLIIDLHNINAPVAALLEELRYRPIVLGSARGILEASWDACVVAVPAERDDLTPMLQDLAMAREPTDRAAR